MGARIRREYDAFVQKNANTVSHNSRFLRLWQMSWLACRLDVADVFQCSALDLVSPHKKRDQRVRPERGIDCDVSVGNWANTPREGRATRQEQFVKARLNIEWRGTAMVTKCDVNGIFLQLAQRDFGAVSKSILIVEDSGCLRRYLSDFVQLCNHRQFLEPTTFALAPRFNPSPRV